MRYDEGAYSAHDIGSLNGTYLDRERIDTASHASGDELQVGEFPPAVPRSWPRPWCRPCSWHRFTDRGLEGDDVVGHPHLSISEVLSLLDEEFPDVTISRIRFLESQGLVDPERTPSGYRKCQEPDIERLRWVLRQQRDAFLPLKVIKDRLEEQGDPDDDEPGAGEGLVEEGYVRVELATQVLYGNGGGPAAAPGPLFDLGPCVQWLRSGPSSGSETAPASRPRASHAHAAKSQTPPVQASPLPAAHGGGNSRTRRWPKVASRPRHPREVEGLRRRELALAELVAEAGVRRGSSL